MEGAELNLSEAAKIFPCPVIADDHYSLNAITRTCGLIFEKEGRKRQATKSVAENEASGQKWNQTFKTVVT